MGVILSNRTYVLCLTQLRSARTRRIPGILCAVPKDQARPTSDRLLYPVASQRRQFLFFFTGSQTVDTLRRHATADAILEKESLFRFGVAPSLWTHSMDDR